MLALAASGCGAAIVMAGEATLSQATNQAVQAGEAQERRANAEANAAAERKRQDENARIRATGELLAREQPAPAAGERDSDLPEHVDRAMITAAIDAAKADVVACGTPSVHARIVLTVKVTGDGGVESVDVAPTPHATLADCVVVAIRRATFSRTHRGGKFTYPFVF